MESMEPTTEPTIEGSGFLHSDDAIDQCIQDCLTCYQACLNCISHCLDRGGEHSSKNHITLMMECAQICNTCASMLRMNGRYSDELCKLCSTICDACEANCRSMDVNDLVMQRCADDCARCADSCRNMVH